jgi:NhaP-type Na+/H+ or K+/H+ antiporter
MIYVLPSQTDGLGIFLAFFFYVAVFQGMRFGGQGFFASLLWPVMLGTAIGEILKQHGARLMSNRRDTDP